MSFKTSGKTPFIKLKGYKETVARLAKMCEDPTGAFENTCKDLKKRVPGKVADAVRAQFNIKKNEILPNGTKGKKAPTRKAGKISTTGSTIGSLAFYYTGRPLTPTHFGMKPSMPSGMPIKKGIQYKIKKGGWRSLPKGKRHFFLNAGQTRKRASMKNTLIPFKRKGTKRDAPIEPVKTTSLPQMIEYPKVREQITHDINKLTEERFNHHLKRAIEK